MSFSLASFCDGNLIRGTLAYPKEICTGKVYAAEHGMKEIVYVQSLWGTDQTIDPLRGSETPKKGS